VGSYAGEYFDGQTVAIEWAGSDPAGFRGWTLDGAAAGAGLRLEFAADRDRTVAGAP